jgi:acetate kinase
MNQTVRYSKVMETLSATIFTGGIGHQIVPIRSNAMDGSEKMTRLCDV